MTPKILCQPVLAGDAAEGNDCYTLQLDGHRMVVDPSRKGEPGDIVVVWPRKKGPVVTRRLARCAPYRTFHFRSLDTGGVFELPCNKVSAIHAVEHLSGGAA